MEPGSDFDLLAASLRADATDLEAFVEALATKLEGSFPGLVRVERKGGLLSKKRVERLAVSLDDHSFELEKDGGDVSCRRRNVVRGIALKNEELSVEQWIDDLSAALLRAANESERGRVALQRLLDS